MWKQNLLRLFDNGIVRQFVVFSADLADIAAAKPPDPRVRWAREADRDRLIDAGLGAHLVAACPNGGPRIAILEEKGRLVAWNCYWTNPINAGGLIYKPPADAVMATDGFVVPEFRGRRRLAAVKAFAARAFLEAGYRRMVSWSRWRNVASTRAHAHVGAHPMLRIVMIRGPYRLRAVWAGKRFSFGRLVKENRKVVNLP